MQFSKNKFARSLIIFAFLGLSQFSLANSHAEETPPEASKPNFCSRILGEVSGFIKERVFRSNKISPKEYEELRKKTVSSYFPNGEISQENIDKFYADYEKVVNNFGRMQLGEGPLLDRKLPNVKDAEEHWKSVRDDVMKYGFVEAEKNSTLEQLLLNQHFEYSRPQEKPTMKERGKQFVKDLPWIPLVFTKNAALFLIGESKWAFRSAILGGTLAVMLRLFTDPINDNIAIFMNDHFGFIGIKMQLWFTDLVRARKKLDDMVAVKNQMAEVNRKYQMNEMTEEEAMIVWRKLEETFLNYVQEMNSVVPDNVAKGRVYFRDGNIMNPIHFVAATSSVQAEILAHEAAIRDLEQIEIRQGSLNERQKAELASSERRLKTSKQRMGSVLAAIRVHEMIYPELTRAKFQKDASSNELFNSYKVLMGGMHLEDYSGAYLEEMDRVLKELGIQLNHMENAQTK